MKEILTMYIEFTTFQIYWFFMGFVAVYLLTTKSIKSYIDEKIEEYKNEELENE